MSHPDQTLPQTQREADLGRAGEQGDDSHPGRLELGRVALGHGIAAAVGRGWD